MATGLDILASSENSTCFESLFENLPLPMWAFDEETLQFLAVNEAAIEKYGYAREEFLSMTLDQIAAPGEGGRITAYLERVRLGKGATHGRCGPWLHRCKDGHTIEVEGAWSTLPSHRRDAIVTVLDDITARRRVEESSREQTRLLDLASDAIIVCGLAGDITFWNQGAEHLYGWSAEEALGNPMVELLACDCEKLGETERGVRESGEWSGELRQKSKRGGDLIVNSRWTLVHDQAGEAKSVLVINTDLTETKKLEAQFLRTQRLESIGTLASGIAHDLNNILAPIIMSAAVLRRSVVTADGEKMLGIIESSAERGAGIVKQVLTFARGVEGERVLLQPKHLIGEMSKILAQTFPRNIDLQTQFPHDLWTVTGDATQLHQVLLNLCVNARDAMMPKGGVIILAAENMDIDPHFAKMHPDAKLGPHVVLRVTDAGAGMSAETMDKIFDPFFTTKEVGKGTGLGLATVLGIVKTHTGFITVQSEIGVGTTFRIYIPASGAGAKSEIGSGAENIPRGRGELVLVVDDEAAIREALVQTLQEHGYRAYTAEDGSDALALFSHRRDEIKVVLTDLAMAQMDGLALVRALRKLNSDVRVIVSSGHCQPEQARTLQALGVKTFLDKPYSASKLMKALKDVLAAAAPRSGSAPA